MKKVLSESKAKNTLPTTAKIAEMIRQKNSVLPVAWDGGKIGMQIQKLFADDFSPSSYRKHLSMVLAQLENNQVFRGMFHSPEISRRLIVNLYHFFESIGEKEIEIFFDLLKLETEKLNEKQKGQILEFYFPPEINGSDDLPF